MFAYKSIAIDKPVFVNFLINFFFTFHHSVICLVYFWGF